LDFDRSGSRLQRLIKLVRRTAIVLKLFLGHKVIHFSAVHNLRMLYYCDPRRWPTETGADIRWLKRLGKKIVYSHTGCLDGVSQTSFSKWGPTPICNECAWQHVPAVCSDERNLHWGRLRNSVCDYQVSMGGNRVDYNDDPRVHEIQQFYCLDPDVWRPDLPIPEEYRLPDAAGAVRIYHAVGNFDLRTNSLTQVNVKSTHIYVPLIQRMQASGLPVELVFMKDKPNLVVRYYQAQSDIICDMLTFGFYGANVREGLMLGTEDTKSEIDATMRNLVTVPDMPAFGAPSASIAGSGRGSGGATFNTTINQVDDPIGTAHAVTRRQLALSS
jgi:hypothetical protein